MILGIYQSLIIHIFVITYGVHTFSVAIRGNEEGLLGSNGTEIKCSYTNENTSKIFSVSFMAAKNNISFEAIALYNPNSVPTLSNQGQYLKGRVTLTTITESSTNAIFTFNKLMCIDDTFYQCKVTYQDANDVHSPTSNSLGISVKVPPSKPDSVSIVHKIADSLVTSSTHVEYSTSSQITVTSKENENLEQNDTTGPSSSTLPLTYHSSSFSKPLTVDVSSDKPFDATTFSTEQTTTAQVIAEGDNITVVCTGDVGNPPAEYVFQNYRSGNILSMTYTATETNLTEIAENCSYYRTSSFTFQVTAKDNNASIRCVVNSSIPEFDKLYIETGPIEVNYEVRMPIITKYPNKKYYVVGKDISIHLTCKGEGNPQPDYFWYKEKSGDHNSTSENLTITVTNKTDGGKYTCRVSNTFNGQLYTNSAKMQVDVRNEADTSTLPSSSTGSSSGTDEKYGNPEKDLTSVYIGVAAGVVVVLLVLLGCYLFKRNRKGKDESTENNGSTNNLMHYSSKHGGESRPGAYDSVVLEGDAPVMSSGKKGQNIEDVRKHNEEYMNNQTNEEKNESKSPSTDQPVIYAEVNKANKSKNRQETSNQQDDDTYAGTQEGIYDQSGKSRHKVNENAEQYDKLGDIKEQNRTDDASSSLKSNQKGSYVNQALNKGEKQVATVPPISRSSAGSQSYEQTSELSQKGFENVKGTDNTHTSTGQSINQTSF